MWRALASGHALSADDSVAASCCARRRQGVLAGNDIGEFPRARHKAQAIEYARDARHAKAGDCASDRRADRRHLRRRGLEIARCRHPHLRRIEPLGAPIKNSAGDGYAEMHRVRLVGRACAGNLLEGRSSMLQAKRRAGHPRRGRWRGRAEARGAQRIAARAGSRALHKNSPPPADPRPLTDASATSASTARHRDLRIGCARSCEEEPGFSQVRRLRGG